MLLTVPAEILIAIFIVVVVVGIVLVFFFGLFQAKQRDEIRSQPEEIRKKSDAPELPSEGQEDVPIDKVEI
jgi:flagellar basal body-associated protein FliL